MLPANKQTAVASKTAVRRFVWMCVVIQISSETEPALLFLRPFHAFLVITLPDLCPWPAVNIRHSVLKYLARRHWRGVPLNRETLRDAFHDRKRIAFVRLADLV